MTTPPNSAAAQVERIARECASDYLKDKYRNETLEDTILRAVMEAIEDMGIREIISAGRDTVAAASLEDGINDSLRQYRIDLHRRMNATLATLDAVCGKEMK